jgi:hypothetical protein
MRLGALPSPAFGTDATQPLMSPEGTKRPYRVANALTCPKVVMSPPLRAMPTPPSAFPSNSTVTCAARAATTCDGGFGNGGFGNGGGTCPGNGSRCWSKSPRSFSFVALLGMMIAMKED